MTGETGYMYDKRENISMPKISKQSKTLRNITGENCTGYMTKVVEFIHVVMNHMHQKSGIKIVKRQEKRRRNP